MSDMSRDTRQSAGSTNDVQNCPTCGTPCTVASADEGTNSYVSLYEFDSTVPIAELREQLNRAIAALRDVTEVFATTAMWEPHSAAEDTRDSRTRLLTELAREGSRRCCYMPGAGNPNAWPMARCDCKYRVSGISDLRPMSEQTGCCEIRAAYRLVADVLDVEAANVAGAQPPATEPTGGVGNQGPYSVRCPACAAPPGEPCSELRNAVVWYGTRQEIAPIKNPHPQRGRAHRETGDTT